MELEPGDTVCIAGGYEMLDFKEGLVAVIHITGVTGDNPGSVFGVVESQVSVREMIINKTEDESPVSRSFRFNTGAVPPGDYLAVIVFGVADVKVSPEDHFYPGDMPAAGDGVARRVRTREIEGMTITENTGIIGKTIVESHGKGLIKVFICWR